MHHRRLLNLKKNDFQGDDYRIYYIRFLSKQATGHRYDGAHGTSQLWIDEFSISEEKRALGRKQHPALDGRIARVSSVSREQRPGGGFSWNAKITYEECAGRLSLPF